MQCTAPRASCQNNVSCTTITVFTRRGANAVVFPTLLLFKFEFKFQKRSKLKSFLNHAPYPRAVYFFPKTMRFCIASIYISIYISCTIRMVLRVTLKTMVNGRQFRAKYTRISRWRRRRRGKSLNFLRKPDFLCAVGKCGRRLYLAPRHVQCKHGASLTSCHISFSNCLAQ